MNQATRRFRLSALTTSPSTSTPIEIQTRIRTRSSVGWFCSCGLTVALSLFPWSSSTGEDRPGDPATPKARVATGPSPKETTNAAGKAPAPVPALAPAAVVEVDPIIRARLLIAESRVKYQAVQDYSCTFFKRERMDGKLSDMNIMVMKARARPTSLYFKFIQPYAGREAIWIEGKNNGKVIAHEAGLNKVLAGTMHLDPKGDMAMEDNRHPISEAGIGSLIETVTQRWNTELIPGVTRVVFHPHAKVGERVCTMVETIHDVHKEKCAFARVKLYIDHENGLPIRFEGYAWPKHPGQESELIEEYTYFNLKINPGLKDRDFDPRNAQYSYGRF